MNCGNQVISEMFAKFWRVIVWLTVLQSTPARFVQKGWTVYFVQRKFDSVTQTKF